MYGHILGLKLYTPLRPNSYIYNEIRTSTWVLGDVAMWQPQISRKLYNYAEGNDWTKNSQPPFGKVDERISYMRNFENIICGRQNKGFCD